MHEMIAAGIEDMPPVAAALLRLLAGPRVVTLTGEVGAGKTTLVQQLCHSLGVQDEVTSPTFALVNEYCGHDNRPIYHLDLYRLSTLEEALDIGIMDYLDSGEWCFVEWPALIFPLLPTDTAHLKLSVTSDNGRKIVFL